MSVDSWKSVFDTVAVVTALVAFIAGAGALWTGNVLNKRQDEQLRTFDKDLTDEKVLVETLRGANLKLQKEILLMGPRANLLLDDNRRILIDSLKPFASQSIEVRRRTFIGAWNGISLGTEKVAEERNDLAKALISVLKDAGWKLPDIPLSSSAAPAQGIGVDVRNVASAKALQAANALMKALAGVPLVAAGPEPISDDLAKRSSGEETISPAPGNDTIILVVHPQ